MYRLAQLVKIVSDDGQTDKADEESSASVLHS